MKTMVQVFFLPHLFPVAPELVRILRGDLGTDLKKKPKHLAVILPANSTSDEEEEDWHTKVAQLAQWSVACGIQCLSVMRTDRKYCLFEMCLMRKKNGPWRETMEWTTSVGFGSGLSLTYENWV
jgi:hypothetical protein